MSTNDEQYTRSIANLGLASATQLSNLLSKRKQPATPHAKFWNFSPRFGSSTSQSGRDESSSVRSSSIQSLPTMDTRLNNESDIGVTGYGEPNATAGGSIKVVSKDSSDNSESTTADCAIPEFLATQEKHDSSSHKKISVDWSTITEESTSEDELATELEKRGQKIKEISEASFDLLRSLSESGASDDHELPLKDQKKHYDHQIQLSYVKDMYELKDLMKKMTIGFDNFASSYGKTISDQLIAMNGKLGAIQSSMDRMKNRVDEIYHIVSGKSELQPIINMIDKLSYQLDYLSTQIPSGDVSKPHRSKAKIDKKALQRAVRQLWTKKIPFEYWKDYIQRFLSLVTGREFESFREYVDVLGSDAMTSWFHTNFPDATLLSLAEPFLKMSDYRTLTPAHLQMEFDPVGNVDQVIKELYNELESRCNPDYCPAPGKDSEEPPDLAASPHPSPVLVSSRGTSLEDRLIRKRNLKHKKRDS